MKREKLFSVTVKDLILQTFQSGGPGGQHQNKTNSGVRFIHPPSGAVGESRSERSQLQNKRLAFKRLSESPKFKIWVTRRFHEITSGKTIENKVDELMDSKNILVEVKNEKGQWEQINVSSEKENAK